MVLTVEAYGMDSLELTRTTNGSHIVHVRKLEQTWNQSPPVNLMNL